MARTFIPSVFKLFVFVSSVPCEYLRRQRNIYPSNALEDCNPSGYAEAVSEQDRVLPCVHRLQKLEKLLEELNKKPAEIPLEKDQILQQSMDRIKLVESDLENTKRVSRIFTYVVLIELVRDNLTRSTIDLCYRYCMLQ